jgi:hypothetical protein
MQRTKVCQDSAQENKKISICKGDKTSSHFQKKKSIIGIENWMTHLRYKSESKAKDENIMTRMI